MNGALEKKVKGFINSEYVHIEGGISHERAYFLNELSQLREIGNALMHVCTGAIPHSYMGNCPDDSHQHSRTENCPACKVLTTAEKILSANGETK